MFTLTTSLAGLGKYAGLMKVVLESLIGWDSTGTAANGLGRLESAACQVQQQHPALDLMGMRYPASLAAQHPAELLANQLDYTARL